MRRILVGIKRVIDYNVRVRVRPDGSGVVTDGVKMSGQSIRLDCTRGGACACASAATADRGRRGDVGPADAQQQLRDGTGDGRGPRDLVKSDAAVEPPAVARRAPEARREASSRRLVILGKQAIDDDCNQTGQMLAALWNRPQATFASKIEITSEGRKRDARSRRRPRDDRSRPARR